MNSPLFFYPYQNRRIRESEGTKPIMRYYYTVVACALISIFSPMANAELTSSCQDAIYQQNIDLMLAEADITPENEAAVVDAFCCNINLNKYSYEQLKHWKQRIKSDVISGMLTNILRQKEIEILNEIRCLTAEEFMAYSLDFPERRDLLSCFVDSIVLPHIEDLSLHELIYCDDYLSTDFHDRIYNEIIKRADERSSILKQQIPDYKYYEKKLAERLKFLIEYILWTYFVEGHKELNNAYSQIAIVPDDPYLAASQYQQLVNICFPTQKIRETLQKEVDKFCAEINIARKDYYLALGENTYPQLSYKVPEFQINAQVSIEPLIGISEAREQFIRSRENVSIGTSVLGWLFGGIVGLVAQGIGDWMVIDDLVTSEYNARKAYMESVQRKLLTNFANYSDKIISGVEKIL